MSPPPARNLKKEAVESQEALVAAKCAIPHDFIGWRWIEVRVYTVSECWYQQSSLPSYNCGVRVIRPETTISLQKKLPAPTTISPRQQQRQTTNDYQLLAISSYRLPITDYRLPAATHQSSSSSLILTPPLRLRNRMTTVAQLTTTTTTTIAATPDKSIK